MKKLLFAFVLGTFFSSCSSDDNNDNTVAPEVTINQLADETEEHDGEEMALVEPGEELYLNADITGKNKIASYKFDIHFAGDDHDHRTSSTDVEWSWNKIEELEGDVYEIKIDENIVMVPDEIEGNHIKEGKYHFAVFAIDEFGNETVARQDLLIEHHDHEH
ncbi:DUF4625 domain-containing protein [Persicobacter diffluens]|uniref:DUF4625 domain-containing protein n=1 Tax=Persicobacter diffluens TaxID=981 RepID=A0AAN4VWV7_9BACT|nr:hypothetical protein PEDI_08070 [Persicobacter diffluens]